jgi:hypothetical protein
MHQTIDVWSLGCVLSESATWLDAGYQGLTRYRELREKARRPDGTISDAFHNGIKVLPAMVDWHKSIRSRLRKTDTLTSLILDLVENGMLLSDPEERLSAEGICAQLGMIYKRAQAALGTFDDNIPDGRTKLPRQPKARSRIPSKRSSSDTYGGKSKVKGPDIRSTRTKHRSEVFKPGGGISRPNATATASTQFSKDISDKSHTTSIRKTSYTTTERRNGETISRSAVFTRVRSRTEDPKDVPQERSDHSLGRPQPLIQRPQRRHRE